MDKTDRVLLILKRGGLQPSVVPSPPQPSNLSISQVVKYWSTRSLGTSLTLGLLTITLFSTSQVFRTLAILRPSTKSLQLLFIGEGESHCCLSLSTSLE